MFGFGYALVPMYSAICDALGINVLSLSELQAPATCRARGQRAGRHSAAPITVEFDANARGPWDFKPAQALDRRAPGRARRR